MYVKRLTFTRCLIYFFAVFFIGCGPLALDLTASLGANQNIKKTLDINQRQTDAQVEAQSEVVKDVVGVLPLVLRVEATPASAAEVGYARRVEEVEKKCPILECPPCQSNVEKKKKSQLSSHNKVIFRKNDQQTSNIRSLPCQ